MNKQKSAIIIFNFKRRIKKKLRMKIGHSIIRSNEKTWVKVFEGGIKAVEKELKLKSIVVINFIKLDQ